MKFKMIVLLSLSTLMFSGCGHFRHKGECACGKMETKKECAGGECPVEKKCDDCKKTEDKTSK